MKPLFSEEYYRTYWDKFLEYVPDEDYINLEAEFSKAMRPYIEADISLEALSIIEKIEAKKIADRCLELVKKEMETVKRIESGKASFGMMTQLQEIAARGGFRKRFEFNCLQLADFRKEHGV